MSAYCKRSISPTKRCKRTERKVSSDLICLLYSLGHKARLNGQRHYHLLYTLDFVVCYITAHYDKTVNSKCMYIILYDVHCTHRHL